MICPGCGTSVSTLVCRACAARKARQFLLAAQREHLPRIVAGEIPLRLTTAKDRPHVMLHGPPALGAFCGILPEGKKFIYVAWKDLERAWCCHDCVTALDSLAAGIPVKG